MHKNVWNKKHKNGNSQTSIKFLARNFSQKALCLGDVAACLAQKLFFLNPEGF